MICSNIQKSFFVLLVLLNYTIVHANAPGGGDFRSVKTGNWNDHTTWEVHDGADWVATVTGMFPDQDAAVYIDPGHTVTLTSDEQVGDLHLESTDDVIRLNTNDFTLRINGKLRSYSGDYTISTLDVGVEGWIDTGTSGRILFTGDADRVIIDTGEFGANGDNLGYRTEIEFTNGATAQIKEGVRLGAVIQVNSGRLLVDDDHDIRVRVVKGSLNTGSIIVKSGATFNPGKGFQASGQYGIENFTLEEGATLEFTSLDDQFINTENLDIQGTIKVSGAGAQIVPQPSSNQFGNGCLVVDTIPNLIIDGSGNKSLFSNAQAYGVFDHVITDSLHILGTAVLDLNGETLAFGDEGTLLYGATVAQIVADEWPDANGPANIVINNANGVTLNSSKEIPGELSLLDGLFSIENASVLTFGKDAKEIDGNPSTTSMMVVPNGELRKLFSAAGAFEFWIGETTGDAELTPITINVTNGTFDHSTYFSVQLTNAKHPNDSGDDFLTRYWTVGTNFVPGYSYNLVANYTDADINGDEEAINAYLYSPAADAINKLITDKNEIRIIGLDDVGDFTGSNLCEISDNSITSPGTTTFCETGDPGTITGSTPTLQVGNESYTWEQRIDEGNWQTIGGATAIDYDVPELTSVGQYDFRRTVESDACADAIHYSEIITIYIEAPISNNMLAQPNTVSYCDEISGVTIDGSPPSGGNGSFTYQWERNKNSTDWVVVGFDEDFTESTLTDTGSYQYRRKVVSSSCTAYSDTVTLSLTGGISNNSISVASSSHCDFSSDLTITGSTPTGGNGSYSYQWMRKAPNDSDFSDIGGTEASYTDNSFSESGSYTYKRVVTSGSCTSESDEITVDVEDVLGGNTITGPGAIDFVCEAISSIEFTGEPATGGNGTYEYEWYRREIGTDTWTALDSNTESYSESIGSLAGDFDYARGVTSGSCFEDERSNIISVSIPEAIPENTITEPSKLIYCGEESVTLDGSSHSNDDHTVTYQWQVKGPNDSDFSSIESQSDEDFNFTIDISTTGNYAYRRQRTITSADCESSTTSSRITLTVNGEMTIEADITAAGDGANGAISLTVAGGESPYTYSWSNGGTESSISGLEDGTYSVDVTDASGCTITKSYDLSEVTGVDDDLIESIRFYPNPVEDVLEIELFVNDFIGGYMQLTNIQGEVLAQKPFKVISQLYDQFEMHDLAPGMYLISIFDESNTRIIRQKIVKK